MIFDYELNCRTFFRSTRLPITLHPRCFFLKYEQQDMLQDSWGFAIMLLFFCGNFCCDPTWEPCLLGYGWYLTRIVTRAPLSFWIWWVQRVDAFDQRPIPLINSQWTKVSESVSLTCSELVMSKMSVRSTVDGPLFLWVIFKLI